jgi:DNA mismatch repair protein MSH6
MKQYWEIKKDNFDKILFFKIGKFYEIFYDDAIICHRILDLAWMSGKKPLVGFMERALDKYVQTLV